ncbi:response regulator transcription factor [Pedobacter heparinus]|uniref:response regulator transcription factor n=1 Tax=Pedobacter heparinus TaxID=984 RepID=UPI00292EF027|nr:response regulator [Pedobacter heparinus]
MKKILIVDDDKDLLAIMETILDLEGYQIETLADGGTFAAKMILFKPDLILLDVMLGKFDGRILCNALKATIQKYIPVIIISATHDLKSMLAASCKPDDYLAKPFDIQNLIDKVKNQIYH